MVLCNFIRTQLAITSGVFLVIGIFLMGQVLVEGLELHGPLAALTDAVRDKPMHRYH